MLIRSAANINSNEKHFARYYLHLIFQNLDTETQKVSRVTS